MILDVDLMYQFVSSLIHFAYQSSLVVLLRMTPKSLPVHSLHALIFSNLRDCFSISFHFSRQLTSNLTDLM